MRGFRLLRAPLLPARTSWRRTSHNPQTAVAPASFDTKNSFETNHLSVRRTLTLSVRRTLRAVLKQAIFTPPKPQNWKIFQIFLLQTP